MLLIRWLQCDRFLGVAVVGGDVDGTAATARSGADVTAALTAAVASMAASPLAVDRVATCALIQVCCRAMVLFMWL